MTPRRPALRYFGGKWKLAPQIIAHFPAHRVYVEPFGGAASVLLRKPRAHDEIYNDLDGEVVNLFRVLRDRAAAAELERLLALTPFARDEFEASYEPAEDPTEQARRTVVRAAMGFGATALAKRGQTGFRTFGGSSNRSPARDWQNLPAALGAIAERLQGVAIENVPALELMAKLDAPDALIYADPPYVHETRSPKRKGVDLFHGYLHEMSNEQHVELLGWLRDCRSMVALSGYASPLYDDALQGWRKVKFDVHADRGRPRTEVLWLNEAAVAAKPAPGLFE